MKQAIGIDLGGTNMRAALVNESGDIVSLERRPTPVSEGPEATARGMAEMIASLKKHPQASSILGVGIGSPGPLSREKKLIYQTPNLPGFDGFPLGKRVEELSGLSVKLDNDAKCATFGEGVFGQAKGVKNYILLTFGTGIGGGVIVDGRMIYGKSDGACEIGHMTIHPNGHRCACGNLGCFEQYVSATAVERRASKAAGQPVKGPQLFAEFEKPTPWALGCVGEIADDLSIATASLVNIFEPEMIVFGGGLFTTGGGPLCEMVRAGIRERCFKSSQKDLKIVPSSLGGDAGVLGAASLFFL